MNVSLRKKKKKKTWAKGKETTFQIFGFFASFKNIYVKERWKSDPALLHILYKNDMGIMTTSYYDKKFSYTNFFIHRNKDLFVLTNN